MDESTLNETHLLDELGNVISDVGGLFDTEDAPDNGHPKGRNRMELLKRGRFESVSENRARQTVESKVFLDLGVLFDAENGAFDTFGCVTEKCIASRCQTSGRLQPKLSVKQMSGGELESFWGLLSSSASGTNNHSGGTNDMRNRALGMHANFIERVLLATVGDHGVLVETHV